jgi:CDP-diacylglycerol--serine O-phosphatidyltransferase
MKKHVPNIITGLNALTGAVGCVMVMYGDLSIGLYFVAVAALFDLLDGLSARLLNVQSEIGKQLDSLADMVSFGVLPTLVMYRMMDTAGGSFLSTVRNILSGHEPDPYRFMTYAAFLIVPFSAYRLAKFNISTNQDNEFRGLPTPANALMITSLAAYYFDFFESILTRPVLVVLVALSCFLLVSNIRMLAFKFSSLGWKGNELRFVLLAMFAAGFVIFQLSFLPFVIPLYILTSIVGNYLLPKFVS